MTFLSLQVQNEKTYQTFNFKKKKFDAKETFDFFF